MPKRTAAAEREANRWVKAAAEAVATGLLLATVVGSGIMADRLSSGDTLLTLLVNSIATGAGLFALITAFGAISGAHMNPLVSIAASLDGDLPRRDLVWFIAAQLLGGVVGVWSAHAMFEVPILQLSTTGRNGPAQWFSEVVATFGLLTTVRLAAAKQPSLAPFAIALYVVAAYWFTSSSSFANPAVTFARAFTNTFTGIRLSDVVGFVASQSVGAGFAYALTRGLLKPSVQS